MNDFLKWSVKHLAIAVLWVFIFSITVKGRTVFSHLNGVFVKNALVEAADVELARAWGKLVRSVRTAFSDKPANGEQVF